MDNAGWDFAGVDSASVRIGINSEGARDAHRSFAELQGGTAINDLWLTHVRFCNDDEELTHGQKIVAETLAAQKAKATPEPLVYLERVERLLAEPGPTGFTFAVFARKTICLASGAAIPPMEPE
jgi:hypothetical protein